MIFFWVRCLVLALHLSIFMPTGGDLYFFIFFWSRLRL